MSTDPHPAEQAPGTALSAPESDEPPVAGMRGGSEEGNGPQTGAESFLLRERLTALRARWQAAGPPAGVSRWWDIRLAELDAALDGSPAHDGGPSVREAAADDRRWPLQKHGE